MVPQLFFGTFRGYLTTYTPAKAELAENPEGKETKNRKVRPSRCFNRTRNRFSLTPLRNPYSVVKPARNPATHRLLMEPQPLNPYGTYSRKTPNTARKSTTRFSISFSNLRKVPPLKTKMKKAKREGEKRLTYIRLMGLERTMGKVRRLLRKEGSIRLLYGPILITRITRTISRRSTEVGKMCSNKKCNDYHQAALFV